MTPPLSICVKIRKTAKKQNVSKGYTTWWTEEVFVISNVVLTRPVIYKITDYN